jgi:glyoxylase-like metal-dependent hydrolase (beta-lactamase superfamily II)
MGQFKKNRAPKTSKNFTIEPIGKGVWAAIHNDQYGRAICNAGIIDLGDKVMIIDPFMTPASARELKVMAEDLTGKFVCMVINTHYHNDHIRGNQVFSTEATIISTSYTRKEIERIEPAEQEWESKHAPGLLQSVKKRMAIAPSNEKEELTHWIGYYEGMMESAQELKMTLPNITFKDSVWINGSERSVKLLELKGHTESDVAVLVPDEGIVFMGDLLFTKRHPWISDGNPIDWQHSLKILYEDPLYKTYVPGHGPVGGKDPLKELYEYLQNLNDLALTATNDSLRIMISQTPIPDAYADWKFGRFYQPNLQYLCERQFKGEARLDEKKKKVAAH